MIRLVGSPSSSSSLESFHDVDEFLDGEEVLRPLPSIESLRGRALSAVRSRSAKKKRRKRKSEAAEDPKVMAVYEGWAPPSGRVGGRGSGSVFHGHVELGMRVGAKSLGGDMDDMDDIVKRKVVDGDGDEDEQYSLMGRILTPKWRPARGGIDGYFSPEVARRLNLEDGGRRTVTTPRRPPPSSLPRTPRSWAGPSGSGGGAQFSGEGHDGDDDNAEESENEDDDLGRYWRPASRQFADIRSGPDAVEKSRSLTSMSLFSFRAADDSAELMTSAPPLELALERSRIKPEDQPIPVSGRPLSSSGGIMSARRGFAVRPATSMSRGPSPPPPLSGQPPPPRPPPPRAAESKQWRDVYVSEAARGSLEKPLVTDKQPFRLRQALTAKMREKLWRERALEAAKVDFMFAPDPLELQFLNSSYPRLKHYKAVTAKWVGHVTPPENADFDTLSPRGWSRYDREKASLAFEEIRKKERLKIELEGRKIWSPRKTVASDSQRRMEKKAVERAQILSEHERRMQETKAKK
jgi:hypothetical protein